MGQRREILSPNQLKAIRRILHTNPELSGQEVLTAEYIVKQLETFEPEWIKSHLGGTGVLASLGANEEHPRLLFRAELDALPIQESNEFEHRSQKEGISHKCGHDGHMTILLSLMNKLSSIRNQGQFLFLFQPAEETGEGARAILEEKFLDSIPPDYCFALHNLPGYPLGTVVLRKEHFTASVKSLVIKLYGRTSHAAEPEFGINPALAIAEIIQYSQQLHQPSPHNPGYCLITPIHLNMGEVAYGVSAGYGEVHFTIRSWTESDMQQLIQKLMKAIGSISNRYLLKLETSWTNEFAATLNDVQCVNIVEQAAQKLNLPVIYESLPFKFGEDFGAFTQKYRGCMFGIGAGKDHPVLHNPSYDFPDDLIDMGAELFKTIAQITLELD